MPETKITGVFNILATPFDGDGNVDIPGLRKLVNFQIELGAYGLTILGVLGEAAKLTVEERKLVTETVMDTVAGRIPVIVGASHPETQTVIRLSCEAISAGALGVMIHPPKFDEPTDNAVIAFYSEVAAAFDAPIVIQDLPTVNNVIMSPDLIAALADRIPTIRTLKLEDPPLMVKVSAIRARTDKISIFGGLGGMFFLEELRRGADGTMTGFAFTEVLVAVYQAYVAGRQREAEQIFDRYLPLIRFENQQSINLGIRKVLLQRRGAIANAMMRQPFSPIDAQTLDEIDWMFARVGITDPTTKLTFDTLRVAGD